MNSTENIECGLIGNTPIKKEEKQEKDIIMAGIKRLKINTEYHQKNSERMKKERREKFLENQKKKLEKLKLTNPNPPNRKCPSCNIDLYYSNIRNWKVATINNSVCKYCSLNDCHKNPPYNKGIYKRTESERKIMAWKRMLKRNFGITENEYNSMFDLQHGRCKICNIHRNELNENFCVDHCHTFNKIRGLLCRKCNAGLGIFKDDINILTTAIKYLQSNS